MYTGVTSVTSDQSNIGFILTNQRTKETHFYRIAGATESSAMASAQSQVQQMRYMATFPLLLNIADQPTYFMALKGDDGLVKMYAMVNVRQYQIVETGGSLAECEANYRRELANAGLIGQEDSVVEQPDLPDADSITGRIAEIRSAVMDGTTYYFLRLDGDAEFYMLSASEAPLAILLNPGDDVTIFYHASAGGVAQGGIAVEYAGEPAAPAEPEDAPTPETEELLPEGTPA
jgi:hypothetical protein